MAQEADTVRDIRVEGGQRIEPSTVLSYMVIKPGDPFDQERMDQSIKGLFATGLFSDVSLEREGDVLIVRIQENPIINRIAFEGNNKIEDEQLEAEVQLRPRVVYTRTRVQADVQRLLTLYRRSGRFAATVDPKVIPLDQNRVDLVFEINEGEQTGVERINFVGNKAFSDSTLREQVQTRETRWYRFLSSGDTYDPDRLTFDRELLRRFYLSEGYADFRVVSAVAELAPDQSGFYITFTVEEGEQYTIGKVDVTSRIKSLDAETLRSEVTTAEGDVYDAGEVEQTVARLVTLAGKMQAPFADVRPRVVREREKKLINITYDVAEGQKNYVERIDITGNSRTMDHVIRREFQVAEGDPYNTAMIRRSEQKVRDLGFFQKVDVTTREGSQPDRTVVQVDVAEQSTGELSIGAGFSTTDGVLGDISLRERNFLGKGQDVRLSTTISGKAQEFDFGFTEPYFLEKDLSAGVDLFHVTREFQDESSYDQRSTGGGLRVGYPLSENLRQRVYYRLENSEIRDVDADASRFIREQEGERFVSQVGQELVYDRRNSRLSPTEGYLLKLSNDLAGLGGNAHFLRTKAYGSAYWSPADDWVLSALGEIGYIFGYGDHDVRIDDRFFLGGDTLRGFAKAGVGPRDMTGGADDALGGNQMYRGSVELTLPMGLPEEFGILGHLFTDFGSLSDADLTPLPDEDLRDGAALRLSLGAGVSWRSPFGPLRVDLGFPVIKQDYDETEVFRFSFGTRF